MQAELFFKFMAEYNNAVWPAQIIFYALSIFFIFTSINTKNISNNINILILSSKVLQVHAALDCFIIFFNRPSVVVQIMKYFNWIAFGVDQRGDQNLNFTVVFNTNQAQFQRCRVQAQFPASGS